ncbi:MAG: serine hydrolase [Myxococcales bacterium]
MHPIRVPETIPDSRLATLQTSDYRWAVFHNPLRLTLAALNPHSPLYRAMVVNPGTGIAVDPEHIVTRNFEVPSGGGVGTARGIARAYSAFANRELGLRDETLRQLMAPPVPARHGFFDEVLKIDASFSLGFAKPVGKQLFGHPGAFGTFGAGGSFGYADPEAGTGYGYVMNRMDTYFEDPRDIALRNALYRSIGQPLSSVRTAA